MRNLFAWVFNRPVVGEHLGVTLIDLLFYMNQFRCRGESNLGELFRYLADEGYLDLANQPVHAVAMLNLAEHCRLRNLYIDAYAHCAGMHELLFSVAEVQVYIPSSALSSPPEFSLAVLVARESTSRTWSGTFTAGHTNKTLTRSSIQPPRNYSTAPTSS
jgi:hypothetical protein